MARIHGADNHLHLSRVAQNPGQSDGGFSDMVFFRQFGQSSIELRVFRIINEATTEHAVLQGRPGLNCDVVQTTIIEQAVVAVDAALGGEIIHIESGIDELRLLKG